MSRMNALPAREPQAAKSIAERRSFSAASRILPAARGRPRRPSGLAFFCNSRDMRHHRRVARKPGFARARPSVPGSRLFMTTFESVLLLLASAVLVVVFFRSLKLPPVLGYLIV